MSDRRRLDSDVRALLRQPSTPWITFDRASKIAAAEMTPRVSLFPIDPAPYVPPVEPSSLSVASDFSPEADESPIDPEEIASMGTPSRRRVGVVLGAIAASVVVAVAAFGAPDAQVVAAASEAPRAADPMVVPDLAPPDLASIPEPAAPAARVDDARKKLGKLTIRGAARHRSVYLDGKLLLGSGARSFDVVCGTHRVSIDDRNAPNDVDIPCAGEWFVE